MHIDKHLQELYTYIHTYIHTYICIYTYIYIYMYTYIQNTCIHRCIDTYMHMYLMVTGILGARRARRFHSQDAKTRREQPAAASQHRDTVTMRAAWVAATQTTTGC